jgi:hypothetical protein
MPILSYLLTIKMQEHNYTIENKKSVRVNDGIIVVFTEVSLKK